MVQTSREKWLGEEMHKVEVEGNRPRGRPTKTWMKTLEDDMTRCALSTMDAKDRSL
jgi:hypothetical protein